MRVERDQLILMGVLGAAAAAFTVAVYMPVRSQQSQAREQIQAYRSQLDMDLAGSKELPKLLEQVNSLREACNGAQRDVPTQSELASLLRSLSSELEKQHATDKEVQMRPIIQGADYHVQPVSLRFTASFPAVYGFLKRLESMPRLIRIDRLELTGTPDKGGSLTARIELSTFFTDGEAAGS